MKWNRKGFTLIELLVVIAIIAIISAIAIIQFGNATADARDARRQADIRAMQSALELYYNANNIYPDVDGTLGARTWTLVMEDLKDYLASPIEDPQNSATRYYIYCANTSNTDYILVADLDGTKDIGGDVDTDNAWANTHDCERSFGSGQVGPVACADLTGGFCIGDPKPAP